MQTGSLLRITWLALSASAVTSARYMTRFRCLASECEATCCGGGAVPVEQATHRHLRLLAEHDAEAQELLELGIELTPEGSEFARLRFLPTGDCSMLDGGGLCRIQAKFGHDALFDVCATYPRYASEIDGEVELFGTLSCPEVARLALLADDGFEEERLPEPAAPRKLRNRFNTRDPYFQPYREVRTALVRLLQQPGLSLSEKLFVLLWLGDQLRSVLHAGCAKLPTHELGAVLSALAGRGVLETLAASHRGLKVDGELPLMLIWEALPPRAELRRGAQTQPFDELANEVWATYARSPAGPSLSEARLHELWAEYVSVRAAVPGPVRERIDACLARYVGNHLRTTPYMLAASLFAYGFELVVRVALLRFLLHTRLSGFCGSPQELDNHVVRVTYAFVRAVEHTNLLGQLQGQLEARGSNGLAHAVCFVAL